MLQRSSRPASANRKLSVAASVHSPSTHAPVSDSTISRFMSGRSCRNAPSAFGSAGIAPATMATTKQISAPVGIGWWPCSCTSRLRSTLSECAASHAMPAASATPLVSVSTDSRVQPRRSAWAASSSHSSQCMPVDSTACSMRSVDRRRVSNSTVIRACTMLKLRLLRPSSLASAPRSSDTSSAQSIPFTRYSIV